VSGSQGAQHVARCSSRRTGMREPGSQRVVALLRDATSTEQLAPAQPGCARATTKETISGCGIILIMHTKQQAVAACARVHDQRCYMPSMPPNVSTECTHTTCSQTLTRTTISCVACTFQVHDAAQFSEAKQCATRTLHSQRPCGLHRP
jgi:hypothetical protein